MEPVLAQGNLGKPRNFVGRDFSFAPVSLWFRWGFALVSLRFRFGVAPISRWFRSGLSPVSLPWKEKSSLIFLSVASLACPRTPRAVATTWAAAVLWATPCFSLGIEAASQTRQLFIHSLTRIHGRKRRHYYFCQGRVWRVRGLLGRLQRRGLRRYLGQAVGLVFPFALLGRCVGGPRRLACASLQAA